MNEQQERKLNDIAQELALFQMNTLKRLGELNDTISHAVAGVKAISASLSALADRLKTLEDARKVQIELNKKLHTHATETQVPPSSWKWGWLKPKK